MLGDADGLFYQAVTAAAYEATDGHEHTSACSEQTIMPWRPQYNVCIVAKKWPLAIVKERWRHLFHVHMPESGLCL